MKEIKQILIRLNKEQYKEMTEKKAELKYKKTNEFFRDLISGKDLYKNLYIEFLREHKRQGNNLNQLAKIANTQGIGIKEVEQLKQQREEVLKNVNSKFHKE